MRVNFTTALNADYKHMQTKPKAPPTLMAGVLSAQTDITMGLTFVGRHMNNVHSRVRPDFRTNPVAQQTSGVPPPAPSSAAP